MDGVPVQALAAALPEWFEHSTDLEELTPPGALEALAEGLAIRVSRHEKNCIHVPPSLKALAGMKESTLMRPASLDRMRRVLWQSREHEFIRELCDTWIDYQGERISNWVEDGIAYSFPELVLAARTNPERLKILASVLWALDLDRDPELSWSFRLVCGLLQQAEEKTPTKPQPDLEPEPKSNFRKKLKKAEEEVAEARRQGREEAREARREARAAKETLGRIEAERDQVRQEMDDLARKESSAIRELDAIKSELAQIRGDLGKAQQERARYLRLTENLMTQVEDLTASLEAGEIQKLALTSSLDDARRELVARKKRLDSLGTDDERFFRFVEEEIERLDDDAMRLQGGEAEEARAQRAKLRRVREAFLAYRPDFLAPRPPVHVPKATLRYFALGGADEIGASAYVVEVGEYRVLIDCGIRMGASFEQLGPDIARLDSLDAVILTHAHSDHIAWLPALVKQMGPDSDFEIFVTTETDRLAPIMLRDARTNLERQMAGLQLKSRWDPTRMRAEEPYSRQDIERVLARLHPVNLRESVPLSGDLRFTLFRAGHILGAASVLLEGGGRRVFVSSDFSDFWQLTAPGSDWPDEVSGVDLMLLESTYGNRAHTNRSEEKDDFVRAIYRTVEAGGVALLPCFALGRAQEVLAILAQAMDTKEKFPVWIDGMVQPINEVYRRSVDDFTLPKNFHEVRTEGFSRQEVLERARKEPCAIVSSSGMLMGGPIVEYVEALLPNPTNRAFICGYQDEGSPGKLMQRIASGEAHRREVIVQKEDGSERRIRVGSPALTFNLSAHADKNALVQAVERVEPNMTVLVHGFSDVQEELRAALRGKGHKVAPSSNEFEVDAE